MTKHSKSSSTPVNHEPLKPNKRLRAVRSHTRVMRRAYKPAVHAELRLNIDIERALEEDLAKFVQELRDA